MKTILSKQDILDLNPSADTPLIEDYINLEDQLQPNGFDLTLQEVAMLQSGGRIGVSNDPEGDFRSLPAGLRWHG